MLPDLSGTRDRASGLEQRERAREARKALGDLGWAGIDLGLDSTPTEFVGYTSNTANAKVLAVCVGDEVCGTIAGGEKGVIVLDKTPFYAEMGGQVGDKGTISADGKTLAVVDTIKENGLPIHIVNELPERVEATFVAVVDEESRLASARHHSVTHLMHKALRDVLGTHVEQKGSLVCPEYLRFDFSHFQKVSAEELREVERLVNKLIRTNYPLVENREATMAEAEAAGAIMLFGEKYGDRVRIVNFGPSTELCGGTHTSATGTIGLFKIISESAISAGVRRIEAVTGEAAETMVYTAQDMISSLEQMVHNPKLVQAIEKMIESNDALGREVAEMRKEKVIQLAESLAENTPMRGGVKLITHTAKHTPEVMKDLAFALRARVSERLVMVVGNLFDGKPTLNIMLSDDVVAMLVLRCVRQLSL